MTIRQNILRQIFEESVSVKIPPVKILHYTVLQMPNQAVDGVQSLCELLTCKMWYLHIIDN